MKKYLEQAGISETNARSALRDAKGVVKEARTMAEDTAAGLEATEKGIPQQLLRVETTKEDVKTIRREIITLKAELRLEPTVHSRRPVRAFHEEHEHMLRNHGTTLIEMGVIVRGIQGDIPDIKSKIN